MKKFYLDITHKSQQRDKKTMEQATIASVKDGQIIAAANIPEYACAFIHNNKTVVCNTGKMYDISNGSI